MQCVRPNGLTSGKKIAWEDLQIELKWKLTIYTLMHVSWLGYRSIELVFFISCNQHSRCSHLIEWKFYIETTFRFLLFDHLWFSYQWKYATQNSLYVSSTIWTIPWNIPICKLTFSLKLIAFVIIVSTNMYFVVRCWMAVWKLSTFSVCLPTISFTYQLSNIATFLYA